MQLIRSHTNNRDVFLSFTLVEGASTINGVMYLPLTYSEHSNSLFYDLETFDSVIMGRAAFDDVYRNYPSILNSLNISDEGFFKLDSLKLPDTLRLVDGVVRVDLFGSEYSYSYSTDKFTHDVYAGVFAGKEKLKSVDPDILAGDFIPQDVILPAVRVALMFSNLQGVTDTGDLTPNDYLDHIYDYSLDEIAAFNPDNIEFQPTRWETDFEVYSEFDVNNPVETDETLIVGDLYEADDTVNTLPFHEDGVLFYRKDYNVIGDPEPIDGFSTGEDPQFAIGSTADDPGRVNIAKSILSRALPKIRDGLLPVVSVQPVRGGYKIAPDVKFKTEHSEARSICENLLRDDKIAMWSFPERNYRSFMEDNFTQVGRHLSVPADSALLRDNHGDTYDEGIDYVLTKPATTVTIGGTTIESGAMVTDEIREDTASRSLYFRDIAGNEGGDFGNTFFSNVATERPPGFRDDENRLLALLPKVWSQRVPANGGSLVKKQYELDLLLEKYKVESNNTETPEGEQLQRLEDALEYRDPLTEQLSASWGYSIAPNTDEEFPQGTAHSKFSGIGAAALILPHNPEWGIDRFDEDPFNTTFLGTKFRLGRVSIDTRFSDLCIHESARGIPPFLGRIRSLDTNEHRIKRVVRRERTSWWNRNIESRGDRIKRKYFDINTYDSSGFEASKEDFLLNKSILGEAAAGRLTGKRTTATFTLTDKDKTINLISAFQQSTSLQLQLSEAPRAAVIRVYYDYTHPSLRDWYDKLDLVNLTIAKEYGLVKETGKGQDNIILFKDKDSLSPRITPVDTLGIGGIFSPTTANLRKTIIDAVGTDVIGRPVFPRQNPDFPVTEGYLGASWSKQFKLGLFNLSSVESPLDITGTVPGLLPNAITFGSPILDYHPALNRYTYSMLGPLAFKPQPELFPGPTYTKIGGDASGFYPTVDSNMPEDDAYFLNNTDGVHSTYGIKAILPHPTIREEELIYTSRTGASMGMDSYMCQYSTNMISLRLDTRSVDTQTNDRDILHTDNTVHISGHTIRGRKKSDYVRQYWSSTSNLPTNDLLRRARSIPSLGEGDSYPTYSPQELTITSGESISHASEHQGNILVTTDKQVLQIPASSLAANTYPVIRQIMSRGLDTNIVHESTNYFGGQGNQIISFKYYEKAQGYQGSNETKEYTPDIITQAETMIQKHNFAVFLAGGTNKLHLLALGGDRRTNGFSQLTFPDMLKRMRKLDDDRLLIFFENSIPRVLDFSIKDRIPIRDADGNITNINYSDYIGTDTNDVPMYQPFLSRAASLPIINLTGNGFKNVKYCNIKQAMIYLAEQITAFSFKIETKDKTTTHQVNINDLLTGEAFLESPFSAARPYIFEGIDLNAGVAPIVAIETNSTENLQFSTIILEVDD